MQKLKWCYIVQLIDKIVCNTEVGEFLKFIYVFNHRDSVVGQIQHFKLLKRLQTFNFHYSVEWQIWKINWEWMYLLLAVRLVVHMFSTSFILLSHVRLTRWSSPSILCMRLLFKQIIVRYVNPDRFSIFSMSVKKYTHILTSNI